MTQTNESETQRTAEIIWDCDHGPENAGYYARLHRDGQEEDVVLDAFADATNAAEARVAFEGAYGDKFEITRCDEPAVD